VSKSWDNFHVWVNYTFKAKERSIQFYYLW